MTDKLTPEQQEWVDAYERAEAIYWPKKNDGKVMNSAGDSGDVRTNDGS